MSKLVIGSSKTNVVPAIVRDVSPAHYIEYDVDNNGVMTRSSHLMDFTGIRKITGTDFAHNLYKGNTLVTGLLDMHDLVRIEGQYTCQSMFEGCTGLTSIDLSSFVTAQGNQVCYQMFKDCTSLTNIDLSSFAESRDITTCSGMFRNCTSLTTVDLSSFVASRYMSSCSGMFEGCTNLIYIDLSSFTTTGSLTSCENMFKDCINLTVLSFPAFFPSQIYTNSFRGLCKNIPNITLHFPANAQSKVESLEDYSATAPFGAISGTILYDLPSTYTLTGANNKKYYRNPKYDTVTSLAWKVGNYDTITLTPVYYTNGVTDPEISNSIYSDAACTTAVTTISTIA